MGDVQTPYTMDNLFQTFWHHDVVSKCRRPKTRLPSRHNTEKLRAQLHRNKSLKTWAISTARKFRRASPAFENALKFPCNGDLQEAVVSDLGSCWRYFLQRGYMGLYVNGTSAYMPAVICNSCGTDTDEHPRTYFMGTCFISENNVHWRLYKRKVLKKMYPV
jgi:hypothetical protein